MCKMKEFKEKLNNNRGLSITGEKSNPIVDVQVKENLIVKVNRGCIRANSEDIKQYVKDIMHMKKSLSKGEIVDLTAICDCMYSLKFLGVKSIGEEKIAYMQVI